MYLKVGIICVIVGLVHAFGDGAPADVCVKERFNQPNHGTYRSQALELIPYQIVASAASYQPGDSITCKRGNMNDNISANE
jgi:hypothetical protein